MKYLVCDDGPIIFADSFVHKEVAGNRKVLGAGFFRLGMTPTGEAKARCFGESVSLGIKSRAEDEAIINRALDNA